MSCLVIDWLPVTQERSPVDRPAAFLRQPCLCEWGGQETNCRLTNTFREYHGEPGLVLRDGMAKLTGERKMSRTWKSQSQARGICLQGSSF